MVLAAVFLLGRATAIYPLSFGDVIKGARAEQDLALGVRDLAPKGVEVIDVTSGGNHVVMRGRTPDYATLDAYMGGIKAKFGGSFSSIELDPADPGEPHHFSLIYNAP